MGGGGWGGVMKSPKVFMLHTSLIRTMNLNLFNCDFFSTVILIGKNSLLR